MRFLLRPVLCVFLAIQPAMAQDRPLLVDIMESVRADDWNTARALASTQDQVIQDIVTWRALRAGVGDLSEYLDFIGRNGDWPGMDRVRVRAEGALGADTSPATVLALFNGAPPETGNGAVRLVQALLASGQDDAAEAQAVLTWMSLPLDSPGHGFLMDRFGPVLANHHVTRMDEMLWQGAAESIDLMFDPVPDDIRALAVARHELRKQGPGVDALIEAIPPALQDDGGLAWERFNWRIQKDRGDEAMVLMQERSTSAEALGRPARWGRWRTIFARRLLRDDQAQAAYDLASNHFMTSGATYADLEWLSGFIALRKLDDPTRALTHFQNVEAAVTTPISTSRALYWQARAQEAAGDEDTALATYRRAAVHQTAYYGQLAAQRAGVPMDPALIGTEVYPDWTSADFAGGSVLRAALYFLQAGEQNLAEWFMTHLAEGADATGQAQLAGLAFQLNEPHIALRIAKIAASNGTILPRAYFPVTDIIDPEHPAPDALVLSIARRESEFDHDVTSPAGARGLMQLMPGTAEDVANSLDIAYSGAALLSDPRYNARLGARYLADLIDEFGENYALVPAAYNAGPSRARRWIADYGDPRSAGTDIVDWVEMIPFEETRTYVMRVSESLAIYRARLAQETVEFDILGDLTSR